MRKLLASRLTCYTQEIFFFFYYMESNRWMDHLCTKKPSNENDHVFSAYFLCFCLTHPLYMTCSPTPCPLNAVFKSLSSPFNPPCSFKQPWLFYLHFYSLFRVFCLLSIYLLFHPIACPCSLIGTTPLFINRINLSLLLFFILPFSILSLYLHFFFTPLLLLHSLSSSSSTFLSVPPLIQPFDFPPTSIGKLMYIACVVSSGDMPIRITWRKDGQEIVPSSGITIDTKEFMSSLQISKVSLKHNGNYTCIASNDAATVSTERQLTVTGKKVKVKKYLKVVEQEHGNGLL